MARHPNNPIQRPVYDPALRPGIGTPFEKRKAYLKDYLDYGVANQSGQLEATRIQEMLEIVVMLIEELDQRRPPGP